MNIDRRLLRELRRVLLPFSSTVITGWLNGVLIVAQAYLLSAVIAGVFLDGLSLSGARPQLIWLLAVIAGRGILRYLQHISAQHMAVSAAGGLRTRLMQKLFDLGPVYAQEVHSGSLTTLAMQGLETLEAYFGQYIPQLILAAAIPLTILAFVFPLDPLSAVILVVTAPLIPIFMILIGKMGERLTQKQWKLLKRLGMYFLDTIRGLTTLKTLNRTAEQGENISRASEQYRKATLDVLKITFLSALALEMLATLSTAIIAVQIGLRLLTGRMIFQQALFILIIAPDFYQPLRNLGLRFHSGINGVTISKQLFEILNRPDWRSTPSVAPSAESLSAAPVVEFHQVGFTYPDRPEAALREISFTLRPGTVTALAGRSGAGKSTLFNLLLRFIEADQGSITINGRSLKDWNPEEWRRNIAWVPQMPFLLNGSITQNIVMDQPVVSEQVRQAVRMARLDEWIDTLPDGLDTRIGEGGVRLSGGQAQRLALARAFYRRSPLVLLDEPGAFVDARNAAEIQESIRDLSKDRTTLIIAHQAGTLAWADQVLRLEDGSLTISRASGSGVQEDELFDQEINDLDQTLLSRSDFQSGAGGA